MISAAPERGGTQLVAVTVERGPEDAAQLVQDLSLDLHQPHGAGEAAAHAKLGRPWVWVVRGTPDLVLTLKADAGMLVKWCRHAGEMVDRRFLRCTRGSHQFHLQ